MGLLGNRLCKAVVLNLPECCNPLIQFLVLWWAPNHKIILSLLHPVILLLLCKYLISDPKGLWSMGWELLLWGIGCYWRKTFGTEPCRKKWVEGVSRELGFDAGLSGCFLSPQGSCRATTVHKHGLSWAFLIYFRGARILYLKRIDRSDEMTLQDSSGTGEEWRFERTRAGL